MIAGERLPRMVGDQQVDLRLGGGRPGLGVQSGGHQPEQAAQDQSRERPQRAPYSGPQPVGATPGQQEPRQSGEEPILGRKVHQCIEEAIPRQSVDVAKQPQVHALAGASDVAGQDSRCPGACDRDGLPRLQLDASCSLGCRPRRPGTGCRRGKAPRTSLGAPARSPNYTTHVGGTPTQRVFRLSPTVRASPFGGMSAPIRLLL